MSQHSQLVTFKLTSPALRAWLVVKSDHCKPLVVEMRQEHPNTWSASARLAPGEYRCRFYCGDDQNVVYSGPASVNGSTDLKMDAVLLVETPPETSDWQTHILVVEDDLDTLRIYSGLLKRDGHIVHAADGYQTALDVAQRNRVDIAVCDIGLWDGNGCKLFKELQKLQTLKGIAVTGFTLADEVEDYRQAGFETFRPHQQNVFSQTGQVAENVRNSKGLLRGRTRHA